MNVILKRRQLILATLVVALGAAVFVNWYFTNSSDNVAGVNDTTNEYVQNLGEAKYVNSDKVETDKKEDVTEPATKKPVSETKPVTSTTSPTTTIVLSRRTGTPSRITVAKNTEDLRYNSSALRCVFNFVKTVVVATTSKTIPIPSAS